MKLEYGKYYRFSNSIMLHFAEDEENYYGELRFIYSPWSLVQGNEKWVRVAKEEQKIVKYPKKQCHTIREMTKKDLFMEML